MKHDFMNKSQGFALPAVAFLIVIVALIIAALERINSNQVATASMGLQSTRAYYAAYSGVEWAAHQIKSNNSCPAIDSLADQVQGFEVSVQSCSKLDYTEGTKAVSLYEIRVLAAYGGTSLYGVNPDFSSRELTVSMVIE